MKVIEKGRKQIGFSLELECTGSGNGGGGCGAKLLVEEEDFYKTSSSHYDGSTDHYTTFMCSECFVETDVAPARVVGRTFKPLGPVERRNKRDILRLAKQEGE